MSNIGFNTQAVKDSESENDYEGRSVEDFTHVVKLFGIPIYSSIKKHVASSESNGRAQ